MFKIEVKDFYIQTKNLADAQMFVTELDKLCLEFAKPGDYVFNLEEEGIAAQE